MAKQTSSSKEAAGGVKVPYLTPKTVRQAKKNLVFLRENAGLSQSDLAKKIKVSRSYYAVWESEVSSDYGFMPPRYLSPLAAILKCDPNLINPACPARYLDKFKKYPPIINGNSLLFCAENPQSKKDIGNNFTYFLTLSMYKGQELAKEAGFSLSTVTKWKLGEINNEQWAFKVASLLDCPVELIYSPRAITPIKALKERDLQVHMLPASLSDLKENLAYYIANSKLSLQEIAQKANLKPYDLRYALALDNGTFLKSSQAWAVANVLGFDAKAILISSIYANDNTTIESELAANAKGLYAVAHGNPILNAPVMVYASGGNGTNMEPPQDEEECFASRYNTNENSERFKYARVLGDSMFNYELGEGVRDGSQVLVDTQQRDVEKALGSIVCIRIEGDEYIIKRLKRIDGVLCVCSDNPRFLPQSWPLPEQAELMGVCVGAFIDLK